MKSFSELTSASQVDNADLVAISQSTGNGYASKKTTVGDVIKGVYASNGVLGAKNLNSTPYYYESQTSNGITWTVNSDGTVTANGTATAQSTFLCHARNQADNSLTLPNGNYILSGCASGGADNKYYIVVGRTYNSAYQGLASDYGSGANVTLNGDDYSANEVRLHFAIVVRNGVTVSNITFKPMIRLASDSDATFQPYAMTNLELTKAVESGGGGTGGHTIIDENGTSMTARAGLQFVGADVSDDATNNKTIVDLASAGGIDGVFVDTSNVIASGTYSASSPLSYTATEDCFAYVLTLVSDRNAEVKIYIDGEQVSIKFSNNASQDTIQDSFTCYLKKGQVLSATTSRTDNSSVYKIYGIQTGTTHSKFQPVIYSLEEREIGVWTDGKPLYQKSYIGLNVEIINASTWYDTGLSASGVDRFVAGEMIDINNQSYPVNVAFMSSNTKIGISCGMANRTGVILTIRYTKTTDVAGSGSWTPQGVPAIHYTTEEQIIGTYFDETLYMKSIILESSVSVEDSWTTIYTNALIGNIAQLVDANYNNVDNKGVYGVLNFRPNGNNLQAVYPISGGLNILAGARITLQYTKSS